MCRKRKKDSTAAWQPGRFDCAYCRRSVRGETHLRHTDESKADLALCTDCYTAEVEVQGGPKWDADNVKVVEPSIDSGPLLVENWLADQEKLLLEGILQYGFGNWRAVSEHVGDKDEKACEEALRDFQRIPPREKQRQVESCRAVVSFRRHFFEIDFYF